MAAHDRLDDALDKARTDAPGPWDIEAASLDWWVMHDGRRVPLAEISNTAELLTRLAEATALAEERLAGLGRLRVECEAWQKDSAGWQARCGELEGLLGEAGVRRDQYKTMYYHLRERLERLETMRGESTPTG